MWKASFSSARDEAIECYTLYAYIRILCLFLFTYICICIQVPFCSTRRKQDFVFRGRPFLLSHESGSLYVYTYMTHTHTHTGTNTQTRKHTHKHTRTDTDIDTDTDTDTDRHARASLFVLCNSSWKCNRILVIGFYDKDPSSWNYTQEHRMYARRKAIQNPMTRIVHNFLSCVYPVTLCQRYIGSLS